MPKRDSAPIGAPCWIDLFTTDPGGAAIGRWQPGEHQGFGIYSEFNAPTWFELQQVT